MNAPLVAVSSSPKPPKLEAYAKVRSQCVDAFARLEYTVIILCNRFDLKLASRALIGQRIKKIRDPEVTDLLAEVDRQSLLQLLDQAEARLRERTDIVHSEMVLASTELDTMAVFRNSADRAEGRPEARAYSLPMLRKLALDVNDLAARLEKLKAAPASQLIKAKSA